ncbi:hypothetical protein H2201_008928 [Coniosporium apollinis]|uniref:FluG domain-containing protein n=1 Tax=Coniosporium apollinis TaxID=61459 RepID=A0ABQ9NLJ8_9PEZI|nr:hypothetical protein H2201_008928 [Coniosporium apollinis]
MAAAPAIPIRTGRRPQNRPTRPPHKGTWSVKEEDRSLLRVSSDSDREIVTDPDPAPELDPASDTRLDFCRKIKAAPDETLTLCEAETIKTYLEWRIKAFRIKKESSIKAYWKRLSCAYIDLAGHSMDNGTELDIRDWIPTYLTPTYKLDTSEKDKLAMYVQDLYVVIHAHWAEDTKALHGRLRVEISLLLLLSAATTTRPGALVESGSAKGSNKALSYEHISIMKVRDVKDANRTTIVAMVNLVHVKNPGGKGRRKKFIFHLENIPAFCIVSHILSIAFADNAFRSDFASVKEIFSLEIPPRRDVLRLRFKKEKEKQSIFRNVERTPDGIRVSNSKALPDYKYRGHFVWLGRLTGFESRLELYQVRRASGRNINSVLTLEERNQTMGHHGSTYEQFYMPDLIERDFQSIYFGTPSQDVLIQSVARMRLSRDKRAPTELTDEQKLEVRNNPKLVKLHKNRERCKKKIRDRGYYSIKAAKGTCLYARYEETNRKINNLTNTLRRRRLDQAILEFHDSIDTIEIDRQLDGINVPTTPARPILQFEHRERATIARLLSQPLDELDEASATKLRARFIRNLASLCHRHESRQYKVSNKKIHIWFESGQTKKVGGAIGTKRSLSDPSNAGAQKRQKSPEEGCNNTSGTQESQDKTQMLIPIKEEDVEIVHNPYPMVFADPVCLICIGGEELSRERQTRPNIRDRKQIGRHWRAEDADVGSEVEMGSQDAGISTALEYGIIIRPY